MKYLLLVGLLGACTQKIQVVELGNVVTKTVSMYDLKTTKETVSSKVVAADVPDTQSCTYSGYCFNCGLKFSGKVYECGWGLYYACNGKESIIADLVESIVRNKYQVKNQVMYSPTSVEKSKIVKKVTGDCK